MFPMKKGIKKIKNGDKPHSPPGCCQASREDAFVTVPFAYENLATLPSTSYTE